MDRRLQSALPSALYSVPMWQLLRHNVAVRPRPTSASMGVVWGLAGEIRQAERGKARRAGGLKERRGGNLCLQRFLLLSNVHYLKVSLSTVVRVFLPLSDPKTQQQKNGPGTFDSSGFQ